MGAGSKRLGEDCGSGERGHHSLPGLGCDLGLSGCCNERAGCQNGSHLRRRIGSSRDQDNTSRNVKGKGEIQGDRGVKLAGTATC